MPMLLPIQNSVPDNMMIGLISKPQKYKIKCVRLAVLLKNM